MTAPVLRASQKEVVIKVLKPGVEDVLRSDLNFLQISSQILEFLNPQLARTSLAGIVADIRCTPVPRLCYAWHASASSAGSHITRLLGNGPIGAVRLI